MKKIMLLVFSTLLVAQTAQVQIVHNSPSPTVDVYVDGSVALEGVEYRVSTGLLDLPVTNEVGIAPAGGDVIATFPFELEENGSYVVVASGIVGDEGHPFDLLASGLESEAEDDNSFALKVMHGVTDAPAVDIYADGNLLVENLAFGDFQGYLQVPVGDYTLDITAHGSLESVASFSAPLSTYGGLSGVVYASGFLAPSDDNPAFALILTTPSGYVVELPAAESALSSAQVQIIHNSPYPTVDIYVDGEMALESVPYRASTGLIDLPLSTEVGIAPAGGDVIATFPFQLEDDGTYVVVASGIVGNEDHPFNLLASGLEPEAADENSFALKVMHGVTDAPAVDIYADGNLLVENLAYGEFQGYLQVPVGDYTLDITGHGSSESVASFSAPLATFGGLSGVVYASGFLSPTETDSAFTLVLATPSGYAVELPSAASALALDDITSSVPGEFYVQQNYPNPFNPTTTIRYDLVNDSALRITVYDVQGKLINELYDGFQSAGRNSIIWDATNGVGETVSSGVYLYKIQAGDSYQVKRMMFLK